MGMLYRFVAGAYRLFTKKMTTNWLTEFDGEPCVFCPNHAGAFGPVEMVVHFPNAEKCHPWMNAAMLDEKQVPAYVRQDYWWKPGCKMEPFYNATLPNIAAFILPKVLRSVPGVIPVHHDIKVVKTFRQSVEYLEKGEHLVIFAQQPSGYQSHHMQLNSGWLQIAPMAWRRLGIKLKFYPVHIDYKKRVFTVGKPAQYDPDRPIKDQQDEILSVISAGIAAPKD